MASPYEVAIHLTVSGNAQSGLAGVSQQVNKLNDGVKNLHKAFALLFVGGEMKRFGEEALGSVKKVLDLAGNFQQVQNQMNAMGMTQTEIANATGRAWKLAADNIHVGVLEIMEMNRHAIEIFGGAEAADEHMGLMTKLADLQHRWQAGHTGVVGPDVVTSVRDMMKTGEGGILWGNNPKIFDRFAENLMKSLWATGANVSASQYVKAARAAKGAFAGWSESFKFGIFPAMVQEWQGAGVGASTAYSKLAGGARWRKQGIIEGQMMGIISPEADPKHPYTMRPEYIKGIHEYQADPKIWFDKYLKPVLDKIYGPISLKNIGDRQGAVTRLLSDPNAAEFLNRMDREGAKYEKDRPLWKKAKLDMPDGWAEAVVAFQEKWKDLMVAIGTASLKDATSALGAITRAIIGLTGAANAHPEAAKNLLAIAAGFGAAMIALGALAVSYGIAGLLGGGVIIVGLTALTGALAGLAAAHWPEVRSGLQLFINKLNGLSEAIRSGVTNSIQFVIDKLNELSEACRSVAAKIGDAISWLWDKIKSLTLFSHTSYGGGGFGGGAGITNAAWSGGGGGVGDAGGMQPYFKTRLDSLIADANAAGHPLSVLSGYRSQAHQNALFAASDHSGHWVARHSRHTMGIAADLRGDLDWAHKHAASHGLRFPMPWEKWHIEPSGGRGGGRGGETHVHNHIYMDGKVIAKNTSKHFVRSAQYATSVGRQDGRGTFMAPGAEFFA